MKTSLVLLLFASALISVVHCHNLKNSNGRFLLQSMPPIAVEDDLTPEELRVKAAMEAFEEEQARKANESALIIAEALDTSQEAVEVYLNETSSFKDRIRIFSDFLKNADGVAFKLTLNTLLARPEGNSKFIMLHAQKALGKTARDGFAANVAQAVAYAFTIRANDNDYINVLEVIMERQLKLEKRRKGSGCQFVKDLLSDADNFASERGDANLFFSAFDSEDYISLSECFLDECSGTAKECCSSEEATGSGLCNCLEGTNRCDYNLFSHEPRTVWVCSRADCAPNSKCLCPK